MTNRKRASTISGTWSRMFTAIWLAAWTPHSFVTAIVKINLGNKKIAGDVGMDTGKRRGKVDLCSGEKLEV